MGLKHTDNLGFDVQGLSEAKTKEEKRQAWAAHLLQMQGIHHENEYYIECKIGELSE